MNSLKIIIFINIIILAFSCTDKKSVVVGLLPIQGFNESLTDTISKELRDTYQIQTVILKPIPMPELAFINLKTPRYRADSLISYLKKKKPDSLDHIIAFTEKDISITKRDKDGNVKEPESKYKDWGVVGYGYKPGPVCIISTFRINESPDSNMITRLKKIAIHELGHNFGLDHCKSELCVMKDAAENIKTIDRVNKELCSACKRKIDLN